MSYLTFSSREAKTGHSARSEVFPLNFSDANNIFVRILKKRALAHNKHKKQKQPNDILGGRGQTDFFFLGGGDEGGEGQITKPRKPRCGR